MKNRILLCSIFLFVFLFSGGLQAQDYNREVGLQANGFSSQFGLVYKKQKSENRYFRVDALVGNILVVGSGNGGLGQFNVGFNIGVEKRQPLGKGAYFIRGWNFGFGADVIADSGGTILALAPSVGYRLGVLGNISERFYLTLETVPGLYTAFVFDGTDAIASASLGFDSNAVVLTAGYRFTKP